MSLATSIVITEDTVRPRLRKLMKQMDPVAIGKVIAPDLQRETEDHLAELGPGKKTRLNGYRTTGFYGRAAQKVRTTVQPDGVLISVNQQGIRQRYHGGPIRPVNKRALTIPINKRSYGYVASDFAQLFRITLGDGRMFLVEWRGKGRNKRLEFLFKLEPRGVVQTGDKSIMPTDRKYGWIASRAILDELKFRRRKTK